MAACAGARAAGAHSRPAWEGNNYDQHNSQIRLLYFMVHLPPAILGQGAAFDRPGPGGRHQAEQHKLGGLSGVWCLVSGVWYNAGCLEQIRLKVGGSIVEEPPSQWEMKDSEVSD
jgi:hypothetical protein